MEVDIPLSTLPLQVEQAFVGCPLSFVRESLVSLGRRLTRQKGLGTPVGCLQILTNYTNFVLICEYSCQFVDMTKRALGIGPDRGRQ